MSILCPEEKSEAGLKAAYRTACLKHHPDKGGDVEIMKLVNAAYDFLKNCSTWWTGEQARAAKRTKPLTETMQEKINTLRELAGVNLEIIGSWLWASGLTFHHVQALKDLGMKFSGNKKAWYYHEDKYRKKSKKELDFDKMRSLFGSETIDNEPSKSIAA